MKTMLLVFSLFVSSVSLAEVDPYFVITKKTVQDVTAQYESIHRLASPTMAGCVEVKAADTRKIMGIPELLDPTKVGTALNDTKIVLEQIMNFGKYIWNLVLEGKPVVNIKVDSANALPQGVTCWTQLSGWQAPQSKVYKVTYTNGFGAEVVSFAYRVVFTAGGGFNGKGKYITNAAFMPASVNVSWGYRFDAQAEITSVFNTGTMENPVAGMQMVMRWTVDTPFNHNEESESFFVSGDNQLVKME